MSNMKRNTVVGVVVLLLVFLYLRNKKNNSDAAGGGGGANITGNEPVSLSGQKAVIQTSASSEQISDNNPTYPNTGSLEFYLKVQNTTNQTQTVTLFDVTNKYNQQALNNPVYAFDLTTELANAAIYSSNTLFCYASLSNGSIVQYNYANPSGAFTNVSQVLVGLNSFPLGTWSNPSGNIVSVGVASGESISSISITNTYIASAFSSPQYSRYGSLIYDKGFLQNGTGTFTRINTSNSFWINSALNTTDGAMNRNGVWNNSIPSGMPIGSSFSYTNNTGSPLTVYVGIGGDDDFDFYLNDSLIVNYDIAANITDIQNQIGVTTVEPSYQCWSIYPVTLRVGNNLFQFFNKNIIAPPSALAVEVYNNTAAQIAAAVDYTTLNILFRTSTLVGSIIY